MIKLSVIVPVYHNQDSLEELAARIASTCNAIVPDSFEVIFIDDGSRDSSWTVIRSIAASHPNVLGASLSKNFGSQIAILAGMSIASGDRFAVIAADLQEPPELLTDLWNACEAGSEISLATRLTRADPWATRFFARAFYALLVRFAIPDMPHGGFDCFVASRRVKELLLLHARPGTYLPGELLWLGFTRTIIPYHRLERPSGTSKWTFWRKVLFLIDSFIAFSYAPIRLTSILGFLSAASGFFYAFTILFWRFTANVHVEGWASLAIIVLVLGGLQLMFLGVLGEYIWRTLDSARHRSLYIISSTINVHRQSERSDH